MAPARCPLEEIIGRRGDVQFSSRRYLASDEVKYAVRGTTAISVVMLVVASVSTALMRSSSTADDLLLCDNETTSRRRKRVSHIQRQSDFATSGVSPAIRRSRSLIHTRRPTNDESYSHSTASRRRRRPPSMNIHRDEQSGDGPPADRLDAVARRRRVATVNVVLE